MTFWNAFRASYRGGIAIMLACPLLALVPVVFEIVQHAVEVQIGMYDSLAAAEATENHPLRMAFGVLKVTSLILPVYWVARYLETSDSRFATQFDRAAVTLFVGFVAFQVMLAGLQLFILPRAGWWLLAAFVGGQVIGVLVSAWGIAAALGNDAIGPRRSIAVMAPQLGWSFAFSITVMLPLMIPHYALGAAALLGPKVLLWPLLILDSLLVGWIATVMAAGSYYAVRRATERAGVALRPVGQSALA